MVGLWSHQQQEFAIHMISKLFTNKNKTKNIFKHLQDQFQYRYPCHEVGASCCLQSVAPITVQVSEAIIATINLLNRPPAIDVVYKLCLQFATSYYLSVCLWVCLPVALNDGLQLVYVSIEFCSQHLN